MTTPQPGDNEVNKLFEKFLEEKCFKPEVKEKMRSFPATTKWTLLLKQESQRNDGILLENKNVSHA